MLRSTPPVIAFGILHCWLNLSIFEATWIHLKYLAEEKETKVKKMRARRLSAKYALTFHCCLLEIMSLRSSFHYVLNSVNILAQMAIHSLYLTSNTGSEVNAMTATRRNSCNYFLKYNLQYISLYKAGIPQLFPAIQILSSISCTYTPTRHTHSGLLLPCSW